MANPSSDPTFINLGDEPTFSDPINVEPLQAVVPIPEMNIEITLRSIPGQPPISAKLQALVQGPSSKPSGSQPSPAPVSLVSASLDPGLSSSWRTIAEELSARKRKRIAPSKGGPAPVPSDTGPSLEVFYPSL